MAGDPWAYVPAFGVGILACLWYGKQVLFDDREPRVELVILLAVYGYMAVIAVLLIAKSIFTDFPVSLEPYKPWYVAIGGLALASYSLFGLRRELLEWPSDPDGDSK